MAKFISTTKLSKNFISACSMAIVFTQKHPDFNFYGIFKPNDSSYFYLRYSYSADIPEMDYVEDLENGELPF